MASSIINSDDGVISGTSGIKTTGGDDGVTVFQQNGTEAMRVTSGGTVGIGTTSPSGKLHVAATTTSGVYVTGNAGYAMIDAASNSSGARFNISADNTTNGVTLWGYNNPRNDFTPINYGASQHIFKIGSTERMRIDSSGNVGIGTSSPSNFLDIVKSSGQLTVNASTSLSGIQSCRFNAQANSRQMQIGIIKHNGITNSCAFIYLSEEDGGDSFLWTDNSGNFRISSDFNNIGTTNGTVVGTQTSDERLKDILGPVGYGLNEILAIEPIAFTMKDDPNIQKVGFSAQQVQTIVPEAVYDTRECIDGYTKDEETGETTPNSDRMKLVMEYTQLIPVLVNAVKELSAKNDALEARIAALEAVPGNE